MIFIGYIDDFNMLLTYASEQDIIDIEHKKIEINKLKPFPNHKFKCYTGQRLENMIESIKQFGVLTPIIVWQNNDDFIILSGHNRVQACKIANIDKISCIIKDSLTLEEATLIVTETNLMQRSFSDLSHSEKAYALEQHYKSLKSQGKRNDLLKEIGILMRNDETIKKSKTLNKVGEEYCLSKNSVARYMRLAKLIPPLLDKVDKNILSIIVGYNLSFIENEEIQQKLNLILDEGVKINVAMSDKLKSLFREDKLTLENLEQYIKEDKAKISKNKYTKLNSRVLERFFDKKTKTEEIESVVEKALELYFNCNK